MIELTVVNDDDRYLHVALSGRFDLPGANALDPRFTLETTARRKPLVIDLSGIEMIGSYGMGMLASSARALKSHGVNTVLMAPRPNVERALRGAGIDMAIPIVATLDEAREALGV